jgi:hypothetical protein
MLAIHIQTHEPHFHYTNLLIDSLLLKTDIIEKRIPIYIIFDNERSIQLFEQKYRYKYNLINYLNTEDIINSFKGKYTERFDELFTNVIHTQWGSGGHRDYVALKRTYSLLELNNLGYDFVWCLDSESKILNHVKIEDIMKHNKTKPLLLVGPANEGSIKYPNVIEEVFKKDFTDFNNISIRMNDFWFIHTQLFSNMINDLFEIHKNPISYFINGSEQTLYEYFLLSLYLKDKNSIELVKLNDVLFENKLFKNILLNYHCMSQFCNKLNEMYFNKTFSYRGDYILDLQKTRKGQILLSKLNIKIACSNYSGF